MEKHLTEKFIKVGKHLLIQGENRLIIKQPCIILYAKKDFLHANLLLEASAETFFAVIFLSSPRSQGESDKRSQRTFVSTHFTPYEWNIFVPRDPRSIVKHIFGVEISCLESVFVI